MKKIVLALMVGTLCMTGCGRKIKRDLFTDYLDKKGKNDLVDRALTDRSYKNVNHNLTDNDINDELATYGDAVIKLCYCNLLWEENVPNLTIAKEELECDKTLVNKVANHYELIDYIDRDKNDKNMPDNYEYDGDRYKYIATAVEAMIGAIYLDIGNKELNKITKLLDSWRSF